jgi:hypothetical protein
MKLNTIYLVNHKRKGTFFLLVEKEDDDFVTGEIVAGKAQTCLCFDWDVGCVITIRKSLATFVEQ